ncbi:unnamed protein product [Amoebophrya sp. A120]|nr:unnamed protein product [Amoebophrya sp. A120]|eukprot:GSA120T00008497001.1
MASLASLRGVDPAIDGASCTVIPPILATASQSSPSLPSTSEPSVLFRLPPEMVDGEPEELLVNSRMTAPVALCGPAPGSNEERESAARIIDFHRGRLSAGVEAVAGVVQPVPDVDRPSEFSTGFDAEHGAAGEDDFPAQVGVKGQLPISSLFVKNTKFLTGESSSGSTRRSSMWCCIR